MNEIKRSPDYLLIFLLGIIAVGGGALGYFSYIQHQNIQNLEQTLGVEQEAHQREQTLALVRLQAASSTIYTLSQSLAELEDNYRDEKRRNDDLEEEVRDTINTVRDLDKLSKTDEELLQKYSKVYFLNENYVPSRLKLIDEKLILDNRSQEQYFHTDAPPFLKELMEEAAEDEIDLKIISAYRSFETQTELKNNYTTTYGTGANAFSADQGYSEHQLGTAVDFATADIENAELRFAETEAYNWLLANAHKFGFVLSYPEGNSFYIFEPWHWRFVGTDLARDLERANAHFYDWDQRTIDEYLLNIFD